MKNNGWISVFEDDRPESGEDVLTLAYAGDFPAPEDLFELPEDRVYCVCTYYYPGDQAFNEVPGDPEKHIPTTDDEVIFDREGFYVQSPVGPHNASIWRRLDEISDGNARGLICWKRLDFPVPG